jgi:anhydro-N-acetylmuramic acid kinase
MWQIWHEMDEETGMIHSTLQIGEPSCIAELTGVLTLGDFRVADVAGGGNGAPLVPILDQNFWSMDSLGSQGEQYRVLQNIGGIGNCTFVRIGSQVETTGTHVLAFDTGPGNSLIDATVRHFSAGELSMDECGVRAARGRVFDDVVNQILKMDYFKYGVQFLRFRVDQALISFVSD